MLYFFGPPGCGKTCLATAVLRQVLDNQLAAPGTDPGDFRDGFAFSALARSCLFTTEHDYLRDLKGAFDGGGEAAAARFSMTVSRPRVFAGGV